MQQEMSDGKNSTIPFPRHNNQNSCFADSVVICLSKLITKQQWRLLCDILEDDIDDLIPVFSKNCKDQDLKFRTATIRLLIEMIDDIEKSDSISFAKKITVLRMLLARSNLAKSRKWASSSQQDAGEVLSLIIDITQMEKTMSNVQREIKVFGIDEDGKSHVSSNRVEAQGIVFHVDVSMMKLMNETKISLCTVDDSGMLDKPFNADDGKSYNRRIEKTRILINDTSLFIIFLDRTKESNLFIPLNFPMRIESMNLKAVVLHSGGTSISQGHYFAIFKNNIGVWYLYDDLQDDMKSIDFNDYATTVSKNGVLFFYT